MDGLHSCVRVDIVDEPDPLAGARGLVQEDLHAGNAPVDGKLFIEIELVRLGREVLHVEARHARAVEAPHCIQAPAVASHPLRPHARLRADACLHAVLRHCSRERWRLRGVRDARRIEAREPRREAVGRGELRAVGGIAAVGQLVAPRGVRRVARAPELPLVPAGLVLRGVRIANHQREAAARDGAAIDALNGAGRLIHRGQAHEGSHAADAVLV
mmetsp:Transcript_11763/g.27929  ORF Transcript_11763/g.27929 Transcript_11763/m.27929 type:complete len:215 (+) Transcript_11763:337-981(+)